MKIKKEHILWLLLISLFLASRFFSPKNIPIFTDEAIYARWAQIALNDPANRFISLEDGKQPLFIWAGAIIQNFVNDPLIALRLVSIFSGFGSIFGIYLLTKELFSKKMAFIASFLYIISPFTLLYDRIGLYDSFLTMIGIYSALFTVKLVKNPNLENAFLTAFSTGAAMITKSSGNFFLIILPFSVILMNFRQKNTKTILIRWLALVFLVFLISFLIYNSLRLSPLFYIIGRKNLDFIRPFSDVLTSPLSFTVSNFKALTSWIITYSTIPIFLAFLFGLIHGLIKKKIAILLAFIFVLIPFTVEVFFNKVLYPRFALFYFPFVLILASYGFLDLIQTVKKYKNYVVSLIIISLVFPLFVSFKILTQPEKAPIPESDSNQFFNDWPAGYGVREIKDFLVKESQNQKINVGTQGTFGLFPFALQIYFQDNKNIIIEGFWPVDEANLPQQILTASQNNKTYFIFNEFQGNISNPRLTLIAEYRKGIGNSYMRLYEVKFN